MDKEHKIGPLPYRTLFRLVLTTQIAQLSSDASLPILLPTPPPFLSHLFPIV